MPTGLFLGIALATSGWALWVRRSALGCRWEACPSAVIAAGALSAYLTSGHASATLGASLHSLTGLWNIEDLIGHLASIGATAAAIYMFLVRLADGRVLQRLFAAWIWRPMTVAVPVMVACHILGRGGRGYHRDFDQIDPETFLTVYWLTLCGILLYMLGYALRILAAIQAAKQDPSTVVTMYEATVIATMLPLILTCARTVTPLETHRAAWIIWCIAITGWAVTPAYSWIVKTRPIQIATVEKILERDIDSGTSTA